MKKITLSLFTAIALTSCAPSDYKDAETTEAKQIKVSTGGNLRSVGHFQNQL